MRDVDAHADDLRALPGKDDPDAHAQPPTFPFLDAFTSPLQRHATAPQLSPPPKPTNRMTSPSFSLPASTVSESAIGIEAALVLP